MNTKSSASSRGDSRVLLWVIGLIGLGLVYLLAVTAVPRWWAHTVGNMVDARMTAGWFVGIVIGLVFTVAPLLVLWMAWRMRDGWRRALWFLLGALVLASPNLATLGIVWGSGKAAHAGERTLDVDGPGFRSGSLVGFVAGLAVMAWIWWLNGSRRRNRAKAKGYRDELRRRDAPEG
jgi:hypothetical protein